MRRADVVDILLIPGGNGFPNHACAAFTAKYHSAEKLYIAVVWTSAGVQRKHLLYAFKVFATDNRFMVVRDDRPLVFRLCYALAYLVAGGRFLSLRKNADIYWIFRIRRTEFADHAACAFALNEVANFMPRDFLYSIGESMPL